MNISVFDIETGSLPAEELELMAPEFKAPSNYKDEAKIAAHIAEQKANWIADAALGAESGRILVIGAMEVGLGDKRIFIGEEKAVIRQFFEWATFEHGAANKLVGFNIFSFDLPFIIRRAWVLGVEIPWWIRMGRYFSDCFIDLLEVWRLGNRQDSISLKRLARLLKCGDKSDDGKRFQEVWETDRQRAIEYLRNDLQITANAAERMLK